MPETSASFPWQTEFAHLNAALALMLAIAILARWSSTLHPAARTILACSSAGTALALSLWLAAPATPSQATQPSPKPLPTSATDANTATLLREFRSLRATLVLNIPAPTTKPATAPQPPPPPAISIATVNITGKSAQQLNLSLISDPPGQQLRSANVMFCLAGAAETQNCMPGIPNKSCPTDLICPADNVALTAPPKPRRVTIPANFRAHPGTLIVRIETARGTQRCSIPARAAGPARLVLAATQASCAPEPPALHAATPG